MLKVILTCLFFIRSAELALHTVFLLGQVVFYTYALFGTLNLHYECGLVVRVLDSGLDVRVFYSHHRRFCSVPDVLFNYSINDIFYILIFHK